MMKLTTAPQRPAAMLPRPVRGGLVRSGQVGAPFPRNPASDHVGNTMLAIHGAAGTLLEVKLSNTTAKKI